MMHLMSRGVITNRKKGFNDGKLVASGAIGSHLLYEFLNDNPSIEFHPSDYVNDPGIIARHNRMVVMNVASYMDLSGQVAADASALNHFSGVSGMSDFMRGASRSEGGKSVIMMTSTSPDGKKSRIVPKLDIPVVIPRGDVQYVVTEYGSFNMFGRSIQERAMGMISIAHPDFREELFNEAKKMGMLGPDRTIKDYLYGIYPVRLEETAEIDGEKIILRPAKAVDERRIQEHFYNLDKDDILSRFFHDRNRFVRDELKQLESDYVKNLTMVAISDELGNVISVGEYLLNPSNNMAEVAFTVHKAYQGKGLGRKLMQKLAEAARENGLSGLFACTSPGNKAMIRVFRSLPYKISTSYEDEMIVLSCKFNEPK
jgi:GNAT superfamily N-acetyltransferase